MRLRPSTAAIWLPAVLAALTLALPGTAAAQQAAAVPTPVDFEFTADGICDFPVHVVIGGKAGEIALPDGSVLLTAPGESLTATNVNDPAHTITLAISGVFKETTFADGSTQVVGHGPAGLFDPVLGFVVIRGNFTFGFDADGNALPATGVGNTVDVCAAIA